MVVVFQPCSRRNLFESIIESSA